MKAFRYVFVIILVVLFCSPVYLTGGEKDALYYLSMGDTSLSEAYTDEALAYYESMKELLSDDDYLLLGHYYNRLGKIDLLLSDLNMSIENHSKADQCYKKELHKPGGKYVPENWIALADNLLDISTVHRNIGNLEKAIVKAGDAHFIYELYGDIEGQAKAIISTANVYYAMRKLDASEEKYKEALKLYKETNNITSIGRIYNNLGAIYTILKDYTSAIEYYTIALDYKNKSKDYRGVALTYKNIAIVYELSEDYLKAYYTMRDCVEVAGKHNDPNFEDYMKYYDYLKLILED